MIRMTDSVCLDPSFSSSDDVYTCVCVQSYECNFYVQVVFKLEGSVNITFVPFISIDDSGFL